MNLFLGFVLGSIVPTYGLLIGNVINLGSLADWIGAVATFSAVCVSLYLANRGKKPRITILRYYHGGIEHITFTNLSEVPSYIIPSIWVKPTFLDTVEQKHPELREIINHYRNITYPLAFDPIASIDEVQTTTKDKFIKAPIILRRNESFYGKTNKELIFQFLNQIASNLHIKVTETELDTGYADIHGHKHNRSTGI